MLNAKRMTPFRRNSSTASGFPPSRFTTCWASERTASQVWTGGSNCAQTSRAQGWCLSAAISAAMIGPASTRILFSTAVIGKDRFFEVAGVRRCIRWAIEVADPVAHQVQTGNYLLRLPPLSQSAFEAVPDHGGLWHTARRSLLLDFAEQGFRQLEGDSR